MARHSFSGAAVATTLSSQINSSVTTIPVNTLQGTWPNTATGPFVVTLDRGTASEEKILVSSYTPTALTATRGYDGDTAVSHQNGATVEHTLDATQFDLHDSVVAGVGTSTPTTSAVGDVAADGTAVTTPAAGDHKHGRESFGTTATVSALGDGQTPGVAATPSRSDHKHGRESFFATAPGPASFAGAAGSSLSPSHGDHQHTLSQLLALAGLGTSAGVVPAVGTDTNLVLDVQIGVASGTTDAATGALSFAFPNQFPDGVLAVIPIPNGTNPAFIGNVDVASVTTSGAKIYVWKMTHGSGIDLVLGASVTMAYIAIGF